MKTEREYLNWVKDYAESVEELINKGMDREEALMQEADNMVIYYYDQRMIIAHTSFLDYIDEIGLDVVPDDSGAWGVIQQIAYWSAYAELDARV